MRNFILLFSAFLCLTTVAAVATPLPVFEPQSGFWVAHPTYERIVDMAYGKHSFALLEGNQAAVIAVGVGVRDVCSLAFSDGKFIAYGNGVFVIAGSEGSLGWSLDLHNWRNLYFDGHTVVSDLVENATDPELIEGFVSLTYLPEHEHFFAQTESGSILVSQNGAAWSEWATADSNTSVPSSEFPKITANQAIFKHDANFLKFERPSIYSETWAVFQSTDGQNWKADGELQTSATPTVAYKRNTWVGVAGGTCFLKIGESWAVEQYQDPGVAFPVQFSSERYHGFAMLGLRAGHLVKYSETGAGGWETLTQTTAEYLQYLWGLDRFFMISYGEGKVECTFDGSSVVTVFDRDDVYLDGAAENNRYLIVVGRSPEGEPKLYHSTERITDIALLEQDQVLEFSDQTTGIDWESFNNPDYKGSPKVVGHNGYFYLATDKHVYRSTVGVDWELVYEVAEHSWVTSLFVYRGKLQVGTTNYVLAHHLYIPPLEGIDTKNAIYTSLDGEAWVEQIVDRQVYLSNPSLGGPFLLEHKYNFPYSEVNFADSIDSFEVKSVPWWTIDGTIVWAYGRYYLFHGDSVLKTQFLGFKEGEYHAQVESGTHWKSAMVNTGYLGRFNPKGSPIFHQSLGEVEFVKDPVATNLIYILSPRWGVLEFDTANAPYAYSPIDKTTYYLNYHGSADPYFGSDSAMYSPFFNHSSNEWTKRLACEDYSFDQWYQAVLDQVTEVQDAADRLNQIVQLGLGVADAQRQMQRLQVEFWIVQGMGRPAFHAIGGSSEAVGSREQALSEQLGVASDAYTAASNAYEQAYGFIGNPYFGN